MQKILYFEIDMAIKDRPKFFQIITLVLFAFSLTVVLVGSFARFSSAESNKQVYRNSKVQQYVGFAASPSQPIMTLKK